MPSSHLGSIQAAPARTRSRWPYPGTIANGGTYGPVSGIAFRPSLTSEEGIFPLFVNIGTSDSGPQRLPITGGIKYFGDRLLLFNEVNEFRLSVNRDDPEMVSPLFVVADSEILKGGRDDFMALQFLVQCSQKPLEARKEMIAMGVGIYYHAGAECRYRFIEY